jgi:ABC-type amino acid transport system permease subunit
MSREAPIFNSKFGQVFGTVLYVGYVNGRIFSITGTAIDAVIGCFIGSVLTFPRP